MLYGRGAADMKSGLAAMVTATEEFVRVHPGTAARSLSSSPATRKARRSTARAGSSRLLQERGERIDWCLVGEPSSEAVIGDTIKVGRRGSLSGRLTVHGVQGHVAYPQLAENPVHTLAPALAELTRREWDQGTEHFQPTTFQVSNLNAGTGAPNVIPGELKARFNLRYSPVQTLEGLKRTVEDILQAPRRALHARVVRVGRAVLHAARGAVAGGRRCRGAGARRTAEALDRRRDFGRTLHRAARGAGGGARRGERSIHKVNESVRVADIDALHRMYFNVLVRLLA